MPAKLPDSVPSSSNQISVCGQHAIEILESREISTLFTETVDPFELVPKLVPWFITWSDKWKILTPLTQTGEKTNTANHLLELIVVAFKTREELFLQNLIDAIKETGNKKYSNLIIKLEAAQLQKFIESISHVHLEKVLPSRCDSPQDVKDKDSFKKFRQELQSYYIGTLSQFQRLPLEWEHRLSLEDIWIDLEIEYRDRHELGHHPPPISTMDYHLCLFHKDQKSKGLFRYCPLVICCGGPGTGKTTLVRKLAFDWANGELSDYDLLLCIRLRDIQSDCKTLVELAASGLAPYVNDLTILTILHALKEQFTNLSCDEEISIKALLVLDGFDEMTAKCCELDELLTKPNFKVGYDVLLTTRTHSISDYDIKIPKEFVHLVGFNKITRDRFIDKFFKATNKDATRLKNRIDGSMNLSNLACIPLLLYLICVLHCDERGQLKNDMSMTKLYEELFHYIIERWKRGHTITEAKLDLALKPNWKTSSLTQSLGSMALKGLIGKKEEKRS